jgi:SAM-dependent methyltransferase
MSNEAAYADGLLNRALDPATQPPAIREYLRAETERLKRLVGRGRRVVDFGCGTGRHLAALASQVALGVGVDCQPAYTPAAAAAGVAGPVHFIIANATQVPCGPSFDLAICTTNTWGTMPDQLGVLSEMRRLAPNPGQRLLSVYAPRSITHRRQWYARLGHEVTQETDEYLGQCEIEPMGEIGYFVLA